MESKLPPTEWPEATDQERYNRAVQASFTALCARDVATATNKVVDLADAGLRAWQLRKAKKAGKKKAIKDVTRSHNGPDRGLVRSTNSN